MTESIIVQYPKTPDFILDVVGSKIVVEIRGREKGRAQVKGIEYERKIIEEFLFTALDSAESDEHAVTYACKNIGKLLYL